MLKFRGVDVEDVMVDVCERHRNPYEAVQAVYVGSAYPLKDADRIDFITENLEEMDYLVEGLYLNYMTGSDIPPEIVKLPKVPTHVGPRTLQ